MTDMPGQIGPFEITRELGRGGMGEVYLARDARLDRHVAIKALPAHLAQDPDRLVRFQREAKVLASLNHSGIGAIYGLEEADGHQYLVLEFVEGETLDAQLARGPIPVDEALPLARQIAEAVGAAHEKGVIHRDLKPGNVMVTPDGVVKVLDFGLARTADGSPTSSSMAIVDSPTVTSPAPIHSPTIPGVIMGTAGYMSPEQARGKAIDKRSDIFSFGCVMYEMLTGAGPFPGETVTDSLGAILHREPNWSLLPPNVPRRVQDLLTACLAKDRRNRLHDIADARLELERAIAGREWVSAPDRSAPTLRPWLIALTALLVVACGGWIWVAARPAAPTVRPSPMLGLTIPMPEGHEIDGPIAISRDGERIAFVAEDAMGESMLYIRELDRFEFIEVPRSRDARSPAFSPDGRSVLFVSRDGLYRAPVDGGAPTRVIRTSSGMSPCMLDDGSIVYSTGVDSPLWRIPPGGGAPVALTDLAAVPGTYAHVWPQQIPGTTKILLTSWGDNNVGGARITDTETGVVREIMETPTPGFVPPARWVASGHLILEAWGTLIAVPFDPESGGDFDHFERNQVLTSVAHLGNATRCVFDVSDDGTLAYVPEEPASPRLVWIDADGTVESVLEGDGLDGFRLGGNLAVSPDGTQALVGTGGIAVIDLGRRLPRRLSFEQGNDSSPVWSSDASRVVFNSNREDGWAVWSVAASGVGDPELVYKSENSTAVSSVGPDGLLCIEESTPDAGDDIWIIEPGGDARPLVQTRYDEHSGDFSIDGRWVAYQSDVSGRHEIYVIPSVGGGQPVQISSGGGGSPKWGPLGTALYYRVGRSIMRIQIADGRPTGEPERVFEGPTLARGSLYSLAPDEKRVLAIETPDEAIRDEVRIITNFFDRIREVAGPGSRQASSP